MELIEYKGKKYPKFQQEGYAAQFIFPFASKFCKGSGFDIGCSRKQWSYPGSIPIDVEFEDEYDAYKLPDHVEPDYIFSSHCLEHLPNWVDALDYWIGKIKVGGVLFLYLPDYSQEYWRPWNNKKHIHSFEPHVIRDFLEDRNMKNILVSGIDLNNSFCIVCEKQ